VYSKEHGKNYIKRYENQSKQLFGYEYELYTKIDPELESKVSSLHQLIDVYSVM
jgi:hypothetical protein